MIDWQGRSDSNTQPTVLETAALPFELLPYICISGFFMSLAHDEPRNRQSRWGALALLGGLEPSTHGLEDRCSIHLSYKSKSGAPAGNRTRDLRIKSPLLCLLSYRRIIIGGREGI